MLPDTKGAMGETFVANLLREIGREVVHKVGTDPAEEPWDLEVLTDGITLEIKTATLGYSSNSFQHEGLEENRRCDGIVFLDIAPDKMYMELACKHTFKWKEAHRRRHGIHYKKDLSLKWHQENNNEIEEIDDFKKKYFDLLEEIKVSRAQKR